MSWRYCHFSGLRGDRPSRGARWPDRAGPGRRGRFAQEDRAEAIGDAEVRVERGRQIEERVEQLVVAGARALVQPLAAVVLDAPGSSRRRPRSASKSSAMRFTASPDRT